MNHLVAVYTTYGIASIGLTIWLARTLAQNGEVFLEDVFADSPRLVASVNRLLVVGFYLLNLGYALITLKSNTPTSEPVQAIEVLAFKLGALLLTLGVMHFGNVYLFHRIRRRARLHLMPPPVEPQLHHRKQAA